MNFRLTAKSLCFGLGVAAVATLAGCSSSDNPNRVRLDALPQPMGTYATATFQYQNLKAHAEDYILYKRFWVMDEAQLPPHGRKKLEWIADKLYTESYPVVIEPSGNEELDEKRRASVTKYLVAQLGTESGLTVVVAKPPSPGMIGDEAIDIYLDTIEY